MFGHVEQHAARDEAVTPVLHPAKGRPIARDLFGRVAAIPHAVVVPRVAERIEMGRRNAMIKNAIEIRRKSGIVTARDGFHPVLCRMRVAMLGLLGKRAAQGQATARPYQ